LFQVDGDSGDTRREFISISRQLKAAILRVVVAVHCAELHSIDACGWTGKVEQTVADCACVSAQVDGELISLTFHREMAEKDDFHHRTTSKQQRGSVYIYSVCCFLACALKNAKQVSQLCPRTSAKLKPESKTSFANAGRTNVDDGYSIPLKQGFPTWGTCTQPGAHAPNLGHMHPTWGTCTQPGAHAPRAVESVLKFQAPAAGI